MRMLDDLSGFEFEETMGLVFDKLGYESVEVMVHVGDEGRDIVMTEPNSDGSDTAVVAECKHTDSVSRPVIQKLDSAVRTYEFDGPKRGMIVTTGRLTAPAKEYANRVDIEVFDGRRIREVADEVGMDIYNGRIEIICEEVLDPHHPAGPIGPIASEITDIENLSSEDLPDPDTILTLVPLIAAQVGVQRTFSTSVGVVHQIDEQSLEIVDASRGSLSEFGRSVRSLISRHLEEAIDLDETDLAGTFESVNRRRFGRTENEYRDWLTDQAIRRYTQTVSYTGKNNVTYHKECKPGESDISIDWFSAVYVPRIRATIRLGEREYGMDWFAASGDRAVTADSFHACRVCSDFGRWSSLTDVAGVYGTLSRTVQGSSYTFCDNCSRIACQAHIRTERHMGEPVCTGCAIEKRFTGAKKFFEDEEHVEQFNNDYDGMGWVEKVNENRLGAVLIVALLLLLVISLI